MTRITEDVYDNMLSSLPFELHNTYNNAMCNIIITTMYHYDGLHDVTIVLTDEEDTQADSHTYSVDTVAGKLPNVVIKHTPHIYIGDVVTF